ncbi:hypothetical protein CAEBREN_11574 [Caenorhabditis brenneri]|uniref:Uncharacterized protein n=1 Tax=Caenorhabditis brenneri TaxID=135651 RepID=G0P2S3_CAEBE|nr:hypothetical protein CAEBREN_11574 [Caenorhabditis brenneri]
MHNQVQTCYQEKIMAKGMSRLDDGALDFGMKKIISEAKKCDDLHRLVPKNVMDLNPGTYYGEESGTSRLVR